MVPIVIKPLIENDAEFLFHLMNTPNWLKYIGDRNIKDVLTAKQYIKENMSQHLNGKGFLNHVIIDQYSGEKVGTCSLHQRADMPGIDIGYALLAEHEGKGFATAGAKAMIKLAFEKYKQKEVFAITTDENISSCQLLINLGFNKGSHIQLKNVEGTLRLFQLNKVDYLH